MYASIHIYICYTSVCIGSCRLISASKETFIFQQKQKRPDYLEFFVY